MPTMYKPLPNSRPCDGLCVLSYFSTAAQQTSISLKQHTCIISCVQGQELEHGSGSHMAVTKMLPGAVVSWEAQDRLPSSQPCKQNPFPCG